MDSNQDELNSDLATEMKNNLTYLKLIFTKKFIPIIFI